MGEVKASIVVVGSEILRGVVQDTNSYWLAKRLTELGVNVVRIIAVPDGYEDIEWALKASLSVAEVVIVTGGLGFTEDDITLEAASRALGLKLVLNEDALEMIKRRVRGEVSYQVKAAYIPEGAVPLYNEVGVSPGVLLEYGGKYVVFLPGVPREMMAIFESSVVPLVLRVRGKAYTRRIEVETEHAVETEVDKLMTPLRKKYRDVYFKTHAVKPVKLTVLVSAETPDQLEEITKSLLEDLRFTLRVKAVKIQ